jgi:TetR/AcrR family transcriptional regulator, cholesterol catabolism regulator
MARQTMTRQAPTMAMTASTAIEAPDPRLDEILKVAAAVFRKRGYNGGTLEEIATKLRIKRPALYYYFRSKEELLRTLLTRAMRIGLADLERAAEIDDPRARFEAAVVHLVELVARERDVISVYFQESETVMRAAGREAREIEDRYLCRFREIVVEALAETGNRDIDPGIATFTVLGMCSWTYKWLRPAGPKAPREIARDMSRIILGPRPRKRG